MNVVAACGGRLQTASVDREQRPPSEEVRELVEAATALTERRSDVLALALVGSWARDEATAQSDVDFVLVSEDPEGYLTEESWVRELGGRSPEPPRNWGNVTERRFRRASGPEVDVGITSVVWVAVDPVDPGTAAVVSHGFQALSDPHRLLRRLEAAVAA